MYTTVSGILKPITPIPKPYKMPFITAVWPSQRLWSLVTHYDHNFTPPLCICLKVALNQCFFCLLSKTLRVIASNFDHSNKLSLYPELDYKVLFS